MLISDSRRDVRAAALNGLFDCLLDFGGRAFDSDTWQMVFRGVIFPLFDDIHHQLQQNDQKDAASIGPPTCLAALTALVRLFEAHLESLSFLMPDVLQLMVNCIQDSTEAVA